MSPSQRNGAKCEVLFTVNGHTKQVLVYPMERLLDVLRNELGLTGTKEGCGEGECGSCSVLLDGMLVNSCLIPIGQVKGAGIVTIEGLSTHASMNPVREAWVESPSMVTMPAPFTCPMGMRQLFTSIPSNRTEHEPHSPSPHPSFVPVNPSSLRSTSNNLSMG